MLINVSISGESRMAVVSNGILEDISMESSGLSQIKGNIYAANVTHVDRGLEAAFIDYGVERHGFIPLNEIPLKFTHPEKPKETEKPKAQIRKGMKLLVQVDREPMRHKGASFTGCISLPGRYLVIMPFSSGGGISRKISDPKERERLKNLMKEFNVPDDFGLIIRTAGLSVSLDELKKDFDALMEKWEAILKDFKAARKPGLVNADLNLVIRSVRDYFSADIEEVWIDNKEVYQSVLAFFQKSIPESVSMVKLYQEKLPLFSKFGIEDQIEGIFSRMVPLSIGGSIVIDSTEALIAIDVNSGKGKGSTGQEGLSFEINKAAAFEIGRQLRLRDLGGLIVIDFIDMRNSKHRTQVKKILQEEMKKDKARVEIGSISKFGLMELSRQRVKMSLYLYSSAPCPTCQGDGVVKNIEFHSTNLLRKILKLASEVSPGAGIKGEGGKEVIEFLANERRAELQQIESDYSVTVHLNSEPNIVPGKEILTPVSVTGSGEKVKKDVVSSAVERQRRVETNKRVSGTLPRHRRLVKPRVPRKEMKKEVGKAAIPSIAGPNIIQKKEPKKGQYLPSGKGIEGKPETLTGNVQPKRKFYRGTSIAEKLKQTLKSLTKNKSSKKPESPVK